MRMLFFFSQKRGVGFIKSDFSLLSKKKRKKKLKNETPKTLGEWGGFFSFFLCQCETFRSALFSPCFFLCYFLSLVSSFCACVEGFFCWCFCAFCKNGNITGKTGPRRRSVFCHHSTDADAFVNPFFSLLLSCSFFTH
jgi:hypothetical protein